PRERPGSTPSRPTSPSCQKRTRPRPAPAMIMTAMTNSPRFDTKIAVVLREDLATWQRLNVTAFLASGIAADAQLLGAPYADADGTLYQPMFRQPVLVFEAERELIMKAHA